MHQIVHVEIPCDDQEAAAAFYAAMFGWNVVMLPEMEYAAANTSEQMRVGFPKIGGPYERGQVVVHVTTPNVEATLAEAVNLGAATVFEPMTIPGVGDVAIFRDPSGNPIGLYTPRRETT